MLGGFLTRPDTDKDTPQRPRTRNAFIIFSIKSNGSVWIDRTAPHFSQ
jgi:hypothetical protein